MDEKRKSVRQRTLLYGEIVCTGGLVLSCAVRDISEGGAKLVFGNPFGVPDRFELHIAAKHQVMHCEVRWRRGNQVGVQFRTVVETPWRQTARGAA